MSRSSKRSSNPAYYIEDCWISGMYTYVCIPSPCVFYTIYEGSPEQVLIWGLFHLAMFEWKQCMMMGRCLPYPLPWGHSMTTWTQFWPFLTTTYLFVDIFNPERGQKLVPFGPPTTSSCPRSHWTSPMPAEGSVSTGWSISLKNFF